MFVGPGVDVYKGQIVGIHQRPGDLSLNVCKKKAATNVRSNKEQTGEKKPRYITYFLLFPFKVTEKIHLPEKKPRGRLLFPLCMFKLYKMQYHDFVVFN